MANPLPSYAKHIRYRFTRSLNQSTEAHKQIGVVKAVFAEPLRVAMLRNGVGRQESVDRFQNHFQWIGCFLRTPISADIGTPRRGSRFPVTPLPLQLAVLRGGWLGRHQREVIEDRAGGW